MRTLASLALATALVTVPVGAAYAQMGGGRMGGGMGWGHMSGMMTGTGFGAGAGGARQLPPSTAPGRTLPFPGAGGTYQRQLDGRTGGTEAPQAGPWAPWGSMMPFAGSDMR